ncbi:MAG: hypothetical protein K2I93_02800, partial [Oscillospiraceae bacterium]|nr:hypothetical protein [Oscillospiraceae bacterium]
TISDSGEINMDVNVSVEYPDGWTADYGEFVGPVAGSSLDADMEADSRTFLSGVTDYLQLLVNARNAIGFFWELFSRVLTILDFWSLLLFALFLGVIFFFYRGV